MSLKSIPPNPERWEPTKDPSSISVPGLDGAASVYDQIDQLEQLITLKLQNIDANFSKIQHLMSTTLLPALKRYAVSTEPVREAAKFWTSFYEETAQIRIPTYEDYSSLHEQESHSDHNDDTGDTTTQTHAASNRSQVHDPSISSSQSSFMPGQAAYSSTPAAGSRHHGFDPRDSFSNENSDDNPSWAASIESPLVRLDREVQNLTRDGSESVPTSAGQRQESTLASQSLSEEEEQTVHARIEKGKVREPPEPLLHNVLRQNLQAASDSTASSVLPTPRPRNTTRSAVSPLKLKVKPKTPIPKGLNPYIPPNTNPADWSGIVDLSDPSLSTPQRQRYERSYRAQASSQRKTSARSTTPTTPEYDDSFDDSTIDLPPGMSPPVTMQFARAPRSSVGLGLLPKLGKTPKNEAADRIRRDIMGDIERRSGGDGLFGREVYRKGIDAGDKRGTESSMSTVPSPPSLSRYTRHAYPYGMDSIESVGLDPSLESMMRRVGLNIPESGTCAGSTSAAAVRSRSEEHPSSSSSLMPPSPASRELKAPDQQRYDILHMQDDERDLSTAVPLPDSDSDSDSLDDEPHNTAHPSAAFLMASQRQRGSDDSFGSSNNSSSDSLGDEHAGGEGEGMAPIHPFARGIGEDEGDDGFDDDSFEDEGYEQQGGGEEETLFGVPPAQRVHAQAPARRGGQQELRLLGEDLLQDTIGIGAQLAQTGRVEESPTPWTGGPRASRA